jgi:hypothetical protein
MVASLANRPLPPQVILRATPGASAYHSEEFAPPE